MISTSGHQLLPSTAIPPLRQHLLPLTTILTPNVPEAKLLLRDASIELPEIDSLSSLVTLAKLVQGLGPTYVLLKGGHLPLTGDGMVAREEGEKEVVANVLVGGDREGEEEQVVVFKMEWVATRNTHGTGCSLACKPLSVSPSLTPFHPCMVNMTVCGPIFQSSYFIYQLYTTETP